MLWILINIRPHIRPHNIDLLLLLWHARAPVRALCLFGSVTPFGLKRRRIKKRRTPFTSPCKVIFLLPTI